MGARRSRRPWVIALAGFRVGGGIVAIQAAGWMRLPRRVHTRDAASLDSSPQAGLSAQVNPQEEVVPLVERASEKRGPEDSV
jgi:hypothetical protein